MADNPKAEKKPEKLAKKHRKKEVGYKNADPRDCCGYCQYYRGGRCSLVKGRISPYKICKLYKPYPNPRHGKYSIIKKSTPTPTDDWGIGEGNK